MPSHQMARLQFYLLFVPIIAGQGQFNSIISSIQPDSLKFLNEIVEISQWGGGWEAISSNVLVLIVLDILLIGALALVLRRARWLAALG